VRGGGSGWFCNHGWTWSVPKLKKDEVLLYSLPSVGPGADPSVQAVSQQVTLSHPPGGRLPFLSARPASVAFIRWRHSYTVVHARFQLLFIYRPRKDERLSWPGWLTCNGRFTPTSGHSPPSAAGRAWDRKSQPARDRRSTAVPRNRLAAAARWQVVWRSVCRVN